MIADYIFYKTTYFGTVLDNSDNFNTYMTRAEAELDAYTMGKASKNATLNAVKMCACTIAEQYAIIESASRRPLDETGDIKSETVGSHSVTFKTSDEIIFSARAEIRAAITRYLAPTGLLYGGVGLCSHHI